MKDKYIYLIVIGVILLILLCSVSIDTKFSFTYMGNTGLWYLTLQLIFILFSKILIGGLSTFVILLVLQLLIILTLVACKSKYIDSLIDEGQLKDLKGMIYFTDGHGAFPSAAPRYDTAFVYIDDEYNNPNVPPWAMKLVLESEEI